MSVIRYGTFYSLPYLAVEKIKDAQETLCEHRHLVMT